MYRTVYFHKTTRAAEVMLRLLFRRYRELVEKAEGDSARESVAPGTPPSLLRAFSGSLRLDDYLRLDDCAVVEFWRCCENSQDPLLRELAAGLLHRKLYKAIDVTPHQSNQVAAFVTEANRIIQDRGLSPEYALADDAPADTPYKPYDPDAEKPATQIYVETAGGTPGAPEPKLGDGRGSYQEIYARSLLLPQGNPRGTPGNRR